MADETVASLGFEVNSKPLDDAKQKLTEVSTEANKTGKAVDDFNQKVGNTGAAATKAADGVGKVGPALGAVESAARRAGTSVEEMRARTAAFSAETSKLAAGSVAAGSAIGTIAKEAGAVAPALGAVGAATRAVTKEHEAHNNALSSLRGNLRGMAPLLSQFGGGLGDILQYSKAARLGLAGFAAVAGGAALVELAKLGDQVERSKREFGALTGSAEGGAKAYDAVKAAAKSAGVETDILTGFIKDATIGQEKFADRNVISANTAENTAAKWGAMSAAGATFLKVMQENLLTAPQEERAMKALGESFRETGTLTVAAFNKIRAESEAVAVDIANAFGYQTVKDFIAALDKGKITLGEFERVMARIDPKVAFDPEAPKTFGQAIRILKTEWDAWLETLAKKGAGDLVLSEMKKLKEAAGQLPDALKAGKDALDGDKQNAKSWSQAWDDAFKVSEDDVSIWGSKVEVDLAGVLGLMTKAGGEIEKFFEKSPNDRVSGAFDAVGTAAANSGGKVHSFSTGASQDMGAVGKSAESMAESTAGSLTKLVAAFLTSLQQMSAAAGKAMNAGRGGGGTEGIQLSPFSDSSGASGVNQTSGILANNGFNGGDAGTIDFGDLGGGNGGFTDNLPAFAGGGSLVVGGDGGTDTTLVQLKATKGEVVTVTTPEQTAIGAISGVTTGGQNAAPSAIGVVSATPEPAALATVKEITDAIDASTIDISKKVLDGSNNIVDAINKLSGMAASPVLNPSTGLPVANTSNPNPFNLKASVGGGTAQGGGVGATMGKGDGEFGSPWNLNQSRPNTEGEIPDKQYFGNPSYGGGMFGGRARPVGGSSGSRSFASRMPTGQYAQRYSGVGAAGGYYGYSPLDPNQFDYLNYDTGYASVGDQQYSSVDYVGSNPFSDSGFGQTYNYGGADQSFNGITTSYNDAGLGNLSYDPGANASGGFDMGYFATGGSFPVPGSPGSGVDKTLVTLHATPGETVTVTPNGVNVPALGSQAAQNADPSSQANITNKTVNIHVQAGIQAESFIRSRAQIQRGV